MAIEDMVDMEILWLHHHSSGTLAKGCPVLRGQGLLSPAFLPILVTLFPGSMDFKKRAPALRPDQ
jgi:hypothetical protein